MVRQQHTSNTEGDTRDDAALLRAVALERDKEAFDVLVARYESFLFSLAVHVTGSTELAEETFQEAMLRVWTSAGTFRGDGVVKAWLVRIVAREGVRISKGQKKSRLQPQQSDMESQQTVDTHSPSPLHSAESAELTGALLAEFKRLPELDRQVVGLHFGGGMTQQEIGQALSVPQQTVSYRLNEALRHLRTTLSAGGYAIGVPSVFAKIFGDALSTGATVPPGLRERVMARIAARGSMRSRRAPNVRPASSLAGPLCAVAAVIALGGAAFWASSSKPVAGALPSVQKPTAEAAPVAVKTAENIPAPPGEMIEHTDWHKSWTFEKGLPKDFVMIESKWKMNEQTHSLDLLDNGRFFTIYTMPDYPLHFTARGKLLDAKKSILSGLTFLNGHVLVPKLWRKNSELTSSDVTFEFYIYHRTVIGTNNGQDGMLNELPIDIEGAALLFSFGNFAMKELIVRPMTEDEVPEFVKHPDILKSKLEPYNDPQFHPVTETIPATAK